MCSARRADEVGVLDRLAARAADLVGGSRTVPLTSRTSQTALGASPDRIPVSIPRTSTAHGRERNEGWANRGRHGSDPPTDPTFGPRPRSRADAAGEAAPAGPPAAESAAATAWPESPAVRSAAPGGAQTTPTGQAPTPAPAVPAGLRRIGRVPRASIDPETKADGGATPAARLAERVGRPIVIPNVSELPTRRAITDLKGDEDAQARRPQRAAADTASANGQEPRPSAVRLVAAPRAEVGPRPRADAVGRRNAVEETARARPARGRSVSVHIGRVDLTPIPVPSQPTVVMTGPPVDVLAPMAGERSWAERTD